MLVSTCLSAEAEIKPLFEKTTLEVGGQVLAPTEIVKSWRTVYRVGEISFSVASNTASKLGTGAVWKAKSDDGNYLHWLAADNRTAYLVGYKVDTNGLFKGYEDPARLRRLDLKTGKWLSDLPVCPEAAGQQPAKSVLGVLAGSNVVAVLTSLGKGQRDEDGGQTTDGYEVRFFRGNDNKPLWSKRFSAVEERQYTGGYVIGIPLPPYADSAIQHLAWMDDKLLVLPEAMQPIYCLNPETGSEVWKQARLWEFQRGFVGPSVWSHYIARFGIGEFGTKKRTVEGARKEFDAQFSCAVVAGPTPMRLSFDRHVDTHSIFVAVAKGPAEGWAGYLSDCLVYELNQDGGPISVATVPQVVSGPQAAVQEDGVVWRCKNNTFMKVAPSPTAPISTMGGGGSDGVLHVQWLRQVENTEPDAWLVTGKGRDPVAFSGTHAFFLPAGGYIVKSDDGIYRFPIAAVDLSTGLDSCLLLCVPFDGQIGMPFSNYTARRGRDGTLVYRTAAHRELAISGLSVFGQDLEVTLGMEKRAVSLRYALGDVLAKSASQATQPAGDPMTAARAHVKNLAPDSLDKALSSAVDGTDATFMRALLEAGADPKYVSEEGWTALMTAAHYGSAEMVNLLISAGSDVNARDKNCGGQSVLIWAAKSPFQAKTKLVALLEAGADLRVVSDDGYDALMLAASWGRLAAVEFLLQEGMKASNTNKEGQTALMMAARSGQPTVVSVLLEAGASLEARDNKGMTPLMHAAEGVKAAGAVKALLQSGADPNATDKRGRTALQIANSSNAMGSDAIVEILKAVTKGEQGDK